MEEDAKADKLRSLSLYTSSATGLSCMLFLLQYPYQPARQEQTQEVQKIDTNNSNATTGSTTDQSLTSQEQQQIQEQPQDNNK